MYNFSFCYFFNNITSDTQGTEVDGLITQKEEKITQVKRIYDQVGIGEMVQEKINEYFRAANTAMDRIDVDTKRKKELIKLAHSLLDREK